MCLRCTRWMEKAWKVIASNGASLKMKGNELEEVYFVQNFVASVLVVKHPHDVEDLIQTL